MINCDKCGNSYPESELYKVSTLDTSEFVGVICKNCYNSIGNYEVSEENVDSVPEGQISIFDILSENESISYSDEEIEVLDVDSDD